MSDFNKSKTSIHYREHKRLSSIARISTLSNRNINKSKHVRIYLPTYQLNPKVRFNIEKVGKILRNIVDAELEEVQYNDKAIPELCLNLAESIRLAIKEQNYDRYRIIVCVSIGQKRQQGVHVYHSFLWDPDRDVYVAHNFENCHIFANIVVYGIYLD
ncbi:tctex1 domain-containing protein 1-B-like [Hyposmocoma kahamanoa]|uniref:tctex1 domain-containing protein 1-B-like n=1 Tax=Hyposmocoma kahamanoa TaxID=1477025 RepID=UPI000E6D9CA2|nr:tctex1 domain-containing protein 1-B-like [Hyposmocoma kahamanoa]